MGFLSILEVRVSFLKHVFKKRFLKKSVYSLCNYCVYCSNIFCIGRSKFRRYLKKHLEEHERNRRNAFGSNTGSGFDQEDENIIGNKRKRNDNSDDFDKDNHKENTEKKRKI